MRVMTDRAPEPEPGEVAVPAPPSVALPSSHAVERAGVGNPQAALLLQRRAGNRVARLVTGEHEVVRRSAPRTSPRRGITSSTTS